MFNFRISSLLESKDFKLFFIAAAVSIVLKLTLFIMPFYGLEYEDAFIFTDVGRSININYDFSSQPYQTNVCEVGSLKNCETYATYGGHFIVFPLLIALINKLVGYSTLNVLWLNALLSLLVLFISLKIVKLIIPGNKAAIFFSGLFLATTPFFSIFNTSGLSETFSSIFVVVAVYLYIRTCQNRDENWLIFLTIPLISFSFLIKRENLILLSLPMIDLVILLLQKKRINEVGKPLIVASASALLGLTTFFILNISRIESEESFAIQSNTFSLRYALILFPTFLKALLSIKYFGLIGIAFLFTPLLLSLTDKRHLRILILFSWLFVFMYSFHYRGYYFVKYKDVSTFDTLRFFTNFFLFFAFPLFYFSFQKLNMERFF